MPHARVARIDLPDLTMPAVMPTLAPAVYLARLDRLRAAARERGYDRVVVYADREHSANISYLTGFDPRFEEAMLVVGPDEDPAIVVGIECYGLAGAGPVPLRRHLFQDLGLPNQPRDRSRPLAGILGDEGVVNGGHVGVVGWKWYSDPAWLDAPSYLVDQLRDLVGPGGSVVNAADMLIDPTHGLRTTNEIEQIVAFEYASCQTSDGVRRVLSGLRPGMTEQEAVRLLQWNGMPLSCHLMLSSGPRATFGLHSPTDRRIEAGDRFTTAFGVWGALTCRAGFVVEEASQLPTGISNYVERLVGPYFEAVAEWYEALRIGLPGGALQGIIDRRLGHPFFGIFLNPGHLLHLDEWVSTPIYRGSEVPLRSGMAFQVDIIPATGTDYFTTNIEDGVAIADAALRDEVAARYPETWERITVRRRFMEQELGIQLQPEVLPLSNIPACLPPFLLRPDHVMTLAGH